MIWHQHEEPLLPSLPTFIISKHFQRQNFINLILFTCNLNVAFRPKALTQTQGFAHPGMLRLVLCLIPFSKVLSLLRNHSASLRLKCCMLQLSRESKPPAISSGNVPIAWHALNKSQGTSNLNLDF